MTLQQLEYVNALSKHRNFEKAAESCFVTQPTLSTQIKKLEDEVGFVLFNRSVKPLVPTKLGLEFIAKARSILDEVAALKSLVNQDLESTSGTFRLGIIPTLSPYVLPLFLPGFTKQNPHTHLIINELQSEEIISQLKSDQLDLALLATPLDERQIKEEVVFYEPFLGYFPEGHHQLKHEYLDFNQVELNDLLILDEGHCFRNQTLRICDIKAENLHHAFEYQSGSIETIKRLIEQNMGFSLIPALAARQDIKKENLRKFKMPVPAREVSIVSRISFHKSGLLKAIKDEIIKNLPKEFVIQTETQMIKWR